MQAAAPALLLACAACSGGREDRTPPQGSCAPLEILVDDQPLPAMTHGLARTVRRAGSERATYEVHVFDRAGATCAQLLAKEPRAVPAGELGARAFAGATGRGVAIDAWTQTGGSLSLAGETPKHPGDLVTICVRDRFTFEPKLGAYRNKRIAVRGAFTGTYCGELEL
ncbi:MAG: hypothetical protein KIT31_02075 [Deltaproteobacteria bacterium]|nr:hypothetical protein [Deltaproteobacteria bacterium]